MSPLNNLIMVIFLALLLWAIQYILFPPLISLLLNFLFIGLLVIYTMQLLGLIRNVLPVPNIF